MNNHDHDVRQGCCSISIRPTTNTMTTAPSSSIAPSSDDDIGHWNFEFHPLPRHNNYDITATSSSHHHHVHQHANTVEMIVCISIPLHQLFAHDEDAYRAFVPHSSDSQSLYDDDNNDDEIIMRQASAAKVALADYTARCIADLLPIHSTTNNTSDSNMMNDDSDANSSIIIQTMGQQSRKHQHHRHHNTNTIGRRAGRQNCHAGSKNLKKKRVAKKELPIPFVLERTDCMIVQMPQSHLQPQHTTSAAENSSSTTTPTLQFYLHASIIKSSSASSWDDRKIRMLLLPELHPLYSRLTSYNCYQHVACVVLQRMLRSMLLPPRWQSRQEQNLSTTSKQKQQEKPYYLNAIAFIADGSLLPRKSGRSLLPMPSPPSLPFVSPHQQGENDSISTDSSQLTRIVTVNVGKFWRRYLNDDGSTDSRNLDQHSKANTELPTTSSTTTIGSKTVTMRGMIIPRGVTLIVGGGYHGKSTLLHQALVMGVYDTVPGDGRERCVSHADAVSIRAEDGRYVNNVNISAFISELPKIKSWGRSSTSATTEAATSTSSISTSSSLSDTDNYSRRGDVTCFGTKDASGSTSQAANVIEAIECGASALLVDEDVSAANFMARDGRMRAMIMNEPITPLLYRVNGLFLTKGISTVVVVGGVGDWLDVADAVVLMQDYVAYDGLKKARSVSYQFSYGHVQYAGRGVVHRLPWEVKESGQKEKSTMEEEPTSAVSTLSPLRRRPEPLTNKFNDVAMLDSSSSRLWFYEASDGKSGHDDNIDTNQESSAGDDDNNDDDEDEGIVDMSKCSQLIENASEQLYGCGICVLWLIQEAQRHPGDDLLDLLIRMDRELDFGGMNKLLLSLEESRTFVNDDAVASATTTIPNLIRSSFALDLWETVGCAYRPRRHEVAMALSRLRGIKFEILPEKQNEPESMSSEEKAKLLEEESKKRTLAELWENRRRK